MSRAVRFFSYYPKTVYLDKYNHVTQFLDVSLTPRDDHANVLVSKKELLHIHKSLWKEASVTQTIQQMIFHGEDPVDKM